MEQNQIFSAQALTWDEPFPRAGADRAGCGYFPQEDGGILFRLFAPEAERLTLRVDGKVNVALYPAGGGMLEGTLAPCAGRTGPFPVEVQLAGTGFVTQDLPVFWTGNRAMNYIEIPEPEMEFAELRPVPHGGLTREIFWSHAMQRWERALVYAPAGYPEKTGPLPVVYLLNGGGDNEICWEYTGRMSSILDNLLADGEALPFLAVTINSMMRYPGNGMLAVDDACMRTLTEDLIPCVEKRYRVRPGRENRAIAGLSLGAYMTNDIGFLHPELFGSIGQFTASMTHDTLKMYYKRPYPAVLAAGAAAFAEKYRLFFRSTTPAEDHLEFFEADDALYEKAGIAALPCYHRILYPENTAKWNSWRLGLRDFARLLFR